MADTTSNPVTTAAQTVSTDVAKAASFVTSEELWFRTHQFISGLICGGLIVAVVAITISILVK